MSGAESATGVENPVYTHDKYVPSSQVRVELETITADRPPLKPNSSHDDSSSHVSAQPIYKAQTSYIEKCTSESRRIFNRNRKGIWRLIKIILVIGWMIYLIFACTSKDETGQSNFKDAIPLVILTAICLTFTAWTLLKLGLSTYLPSQQQSILDLAANHQGKISVLLLLIGIALIAAGISYSFIADKQYGVEVSQFISLAGYALFPGILYVFSKYRSRIQWRPVIAGLVIQFCMGLFILKTGLGFTIFDGLGKFAQTFLNFIEAGVIMVFGPAYVDHQFAMKTMPIIIYFSSVVSVLYYLGAMQWVIKKIGWLMYTVMGTSAPESMVAAGNIFIGQTESPLLIRPFLPKCTNSEIMAIMAAGMGTIAGSVLGAYLDYGAEAVYLITGSVMAAPCVLALSKLFYPETRKSHYANFEEMDMQEQDEVGNVIEAIMKGSIEAIPLVFNICAILIAVLSVMSGVDAFLGYLGDLVNVQNLTLDLIFAYLFWPVTFMLGVEQQDIDLASTLVGKKVVLNEFIAYQELSLLLKKRESGCVRAEWIGYRSEAIVTYALCGFANISSMGIVLGGLTEMAPKRRTDMSKLIVRALIVGCFTSFQNAAMAGFLLNDGALEAKANSTTSLDTAYNNGQPFLVNCTEVGFMYRRNNCEFEKATPATCYEVSGLTNCCNMNEAAVFDCMATSSWPLDGNCTLVSAMAPRFE